MLVLGHVHVDDAGLQGRLAERDLQDLRHAGVHTLRAAARLEVRESGAEGVEPGHPVPLGAVPADRALGLGAAFDADEGRHRLDGQTPRVLERAIVDGVDAVRKRRIVLGVDGQLRTARRDLAQHRLHELAGRAVALGDDDEARAHSSFAYLSRSGITSSRPIGGIVRRARKTPASR